MPGSAKALYVLFEKLPSPQAEAETMHGLLIWLQPASKVERFDSMRVSAHKFEATGNNYAGPL